MNNQAVQIKLEPVRVSKRLAEIIIGECEYWCLNFGYLSELVIDDHEAFNNHFKCYVADRCQDSLYNACCSLSIPEMEVYYSIVEMVDKKIADLIGYEADLVLEEGPIELAAERKTHELLDYIKAIEHSIKIIGSEGNNIEHE